MTHTEEEAQGKWCPMDRMHVKREIYPKCLASDCMLWVEDKPPTKTVCAHCEKEQHAVGGRTCGENPHGDIRHVWQTRGDDGSWGHCGLAKG